MDKGKTLKDLPLEVGQTYICVHTEYTYWTVGKEYTVVTKGKLPENNGDGQLSSVSTFVLKEPSPKTFGEMTDEEKGALLLAYHEGKTVEYYSPHHRAWVIDMPHWSIRTAYRVKPKPVVVEVVLYGGYNPTSGWVFSPRAVNKDTHKQTFNTVDGEMDCTSIRMEKL